MDTQNINTGGGENSATKVQEVDIQIPTNPADPAFFNLTLEARHKAYHLLLDPKGTNTLVVEPPNSLDAVTKLLAISEQVRDEVTTLIASDYKARIQAGLYYNLKLEPHTIAVAGPKKKSKKSKKQDPSPTTAPLPAIKLWTLDIIVFTAEMQIRVTANLNFKTNTVAIRLPGFGDGLAMFSSNYCDHLFEEFEEAFLEPMKVFTGKEGFDGVMLKDVEVLLREVELPCPKIGMITEITRTWFVSMLSMTRMMVMRLIPLEGFKSGAKVKHEDTITDYNLDKIGN
ncbi:hypothetical protein D6C99_10492 [Aureobasidium pullulans]|uniref:Uncharacterized protein n=1 Tax=Aureobasidium pullulans TaxID=5580 RepID=A0A4S9LN05_AURPU|nr:hypothetical protein D6D22_10684 [Aureobasidium pullulans]THY30532.1 hypothetical protein D6C99_10492 [Aureobasidium pullulans]